MGKTLAARVNVDADPLSQDQLHVGRVAELNHNSNRQVHPLLRPRSPTTELGTLVDSRVPRCLCFHLQGRQTLLVNETVPQMDSGDSSEKYLMQLHPHLSIVVFDDL